MSQNRKGALLPRRTLLRGAAIAGAGVAGLGAFTVRNCIKATSQPEAERQTDAEFRAFVADLRNTDDWTAYGIIQEREVIADKLEGLLDGGTIAKPAAYAKAWVDQVERMGGAVLISETRDGRLCVNTTCAPDDLISGPMMAAGALTADQAREVARLITARGGAS